MTSDKYAAQKKYLSTRKKLSVWMESEKYEAFKNLAKENGTSVYALINDFADNYIAEKSQG